MSTSLFRPATGLLLLAALAGCVTAPPAPAVRQYLDDRSALTVTTSTSPLVLFREQPWLAAHGRDYVYAGLVEINRMGQRSWSLRLAAWSTIDHGPSGSAGRRQELGKICLLLDGEPVDLGATAWSDGEMGLGAPPFESPLESATVAYYPLTRSQAARIAAAGRLVIVTESGAGRADYLPVTSGPGPLADIGSYLAGSNGPLPAQTRSAEKEHER